MAFDPNDFEVKPIGDAGLTERTVLDGSERILVQGGPDEDVDTTPMEFVKFTTIQAKIDTLKGTGWTDETVKGNADAIAEKANKATPSVSVTASKTLGLSDASTLQICNSASSITITIPTDAVTAFPIGTEIVITRYGAGAVTIDGEVTIRSAVSMKSISIQYGAVSLYKIATDEWLLIGALS